MNKFQCNGMGHWQFFNRRVAPRFSVLIAAAAIMCSITPPMSHAQFSRASGEDEYRAYVEANEIAQPSLKIRALEKYLRDFPQGWSTSMAHKALFDTLVKNYPTQRARILEEAKKALESASEQAKGSLCSSIGNQLCEAGILLDSAEQFAKTGLSLLEKDMTKAAKPTVKAGSNRRKAEFQVLLGRISLGRGEAGKAEKAFKDVLTANPQFSAAMVGMAELYRKRGDRRSALENYISAAAASRIQPAAREQLNKLYAEFHGGSAAGLEEMVDLRYNELFPPPFTVEKYQSSSGRTDRTVLLEIFTGSSCPPCVAADLATDLLMQRFDKSDLAVLMYHEHIPLPDPMTTAQTQDRFGYYEGIGVPTLGIDGRAGMGGGDRDKAAELFGAFTREIERKLELAPEARIRLDGSLSGSTVSVKVAVSELRTRSKSLRLHVVLAEKKLRYSGENGIRFHPMVVRSMASTAAGLGLPITNGESQSFAMVFDLKAIAARIKKQLDDYEAGGRGGETFTFTDKKYEMDPKSLVLVAFVQDDASREVLQSASIDLEAPERADN
jgi:thiol-disulfide isomerase/thioredoxin